VVDRPLDEDDVIERARRGDTSAYGALVRTHQGIAFRTAYLIARDAADAEEAVQDGFVKAYRALGRFRRGAPFRPWLLHIVANEARNRRRSAGDRCLSNQCFTAAIAGWAMSCFMLGDGFDLPLEQQLRGHEIAILRLRPSVACFNAGQVDLLGRRGWDGSTA
jgi:DNA-directed RNA polymerase specialized sigma24 family protein